MLVVAQTVEIGDRYRALAACHPLAESPLHALTAHPDPVRRVREFTLAPAADQCQERLPVVTRFRTEVQRRPRIPGTVTDGPRPSSHLFSTTITGAPGATSST